MHTYSMSALFDHGRQAFLEGSIHWLTDTINAVLVTTAYTPNLVTDQFLSDVGENTIGTPQTLTHPSSTAGVADADDVVFTAVVAGSIVKYVLIYKLGDMDSNSPLIASIDIATGLPISTTGNDINVQWDNGSNRIFKL
jgi:hypothetical protein